jgi:hypothetical protein
MFVERSNVTYSRKLVEVLKDAKAWDENKKE